MIMILAAVAVTGGSSLAAPKPEEEAQKPTEKWLSLVDSGKYEEAWQATSTYSQATIKLELMQRSLIEVRKPLGDVVSRKLKSAEFTKSFPDLPDGEHVILHFITSFTNKSNIVEMVVSTKDKSGGWKNSGYFIKPEKAEQTGAGQPATRPVFGPKGREKPQPEAEGRRP